MKVFEEFNNHRYNKNYDKVTADEMYDPGLSQKIIDNLSTIDYILMLTTC